MAFFFAGGEVLLHVGEIRLASHILTLLRISRSDVVKSSQSYSSGTGATSRAPPVM